MQWAQQFDRIIWFDSNSSALKYSSYDAILAVDAFTEIRMGETGAFDRLEEYQRLTEDWIFGYLSYDLKNDTEALKSENFDGLSFPAINFFQPKKIFFLKGDCLELRYLKLAEDEIEDDLENILSIEPGPGGDSGAFAPEKNQVHSRITKEDYLERVKKMQEYIRRGDIYEANFCQEFYCENINFDPLIVFNDLNALSTPPFAAYMKMDQHYLLSASPERYLKKDDMTLIAQPIKGTAARSEDPVLDELLRDTLSVDPKERSENIMIVDLVRNDLSRVAAKGSVQVEELCRVYSFRQVHQMISTVKALVAPGIPCVEIIKTNFPMGSMTGAPKISAMKIIDELEETKRGLYSGAVGYFTPEGNFDFNVIIRSILYNKERRYASFSVGGAITALSVPEKEYEECIIKARAMREALTGKEK